MFQKNLEQKISEISFWNMLEQKRGVLEQKRGVLEHVGTIF